MVRHTYDCQDGCPVESTLQIISGKWKSVILFHLIKNGTERFGDLQRQMKDCSHRMLALQLKELENDGVLVKTIYPVMPPKTEYRLTSFGETLVPVIIAMEKWGRYYNATHHEEESSQA
ncbi:Transcriptional regulator HxlR family [Furfurilactobacillus rossiae]|uniref:winged helix-turn-helix transcriptional regulator n=1 Tax=Furfurilactobacillus rossiae TaxID=231049 RepID=UPI0015BAF74B|nr:helix-turn-helix domain-containing protein [Furfurilactobacillus rossiae]QLE64906.1 Transcriptional regulator HxlR family [Furfurilactobacillus rossiae]